MLNGVRKVVAFFAHSDDEMICAGTLHRLVRSGAEVAVITFAPAATEQDRTGTQESAVVLHPEWRRSVEILGAKGRYLPLSIWNPSSRLAEHGQAIADYAFAYCETEKPDAAFILSPEDENPAHATVGMQCERVMRGRVPLTIRCQFPWNYGIGRPNLYVRLEPEDVDAKAAVIDAYQSQRFRYQYREMLLGYVRADGLSMKVPAAERFELIRGVV